MCDVAHLLRSIMSARACDNFCFLDDVTCCRYDELKAIVVVGNRRFLENEWESINTFPDIYVKIVSA